MVEVLGVYLVIWFVMVVRFGCVLRCFVGFDLRFRFCVVLDFGLWWLTCFGCL